MGRAGNAVAMYRYVRCCIVLVTVLLGCAAGAQEANLECSAASPRYRSTLYATMMTLEGSFRVRLTLPDGVAAVTLVGAVTGPGAIQGPRKTLHGAASGDYHLPFILRQYEPGLIELHAWALDGETVIAEGSASVNVMPRAAHEVTLDDHGALLAQGVPIFAIGYAGPLPERVGSLADAGFGLVVADDMVGLETDRIWDPRVLAVVPASKDAAQLQGNASSGAIGVWLVSPDGTAAALAGAEPYHPILCRTARGEHEGDIVLHELDGAGPLEAVEDLVAQIGQDPRGRPHWALLPSPQVLPGDRLGALALGCAIAGARGVVFQSNGLSPSGLGAALGNCLPRLNMLAPLLLAPYAPLRAWVEERGVVAAVKQARYDDYLLVANLTDEPMVATCRGLGEADGIDIETGEFLAGAPGGAMAVPLDAWAARVVQLRLRNEGNDE